MSKSQLKKGAGLNDHRQGTPSRLGKLGKQIRLVPELGLTQVLRQDQGDSNGQDKSTSP